MKNIFTTIVLIVLLIVFGICIYISKTSYEVIDIISPAKIVVDFDGNKIKDQNEVICIDNIESFSLLPDKDFKNKYYKKLNMNDNDIVNLWYLGNEYASNHLLNKNISIKLSGKTTSECQYADVKINGSDYSKLLFNSGFGIINGKVKQDKFKQNKEIGEKLNLVILNHRSNKYHKLQCKYGKLAHDSVIIPFKHLPKGMKPCKFCHEVKNKSKFRKNFKHIENNELLVSYKKSDLVITSGNLVIYRANFPRVLRPDNNCNTSICRSLINGINKAQSSIDIAIYGYEDIPAFTNALKNAKNRGVRIRFVYDEATKSENTFYKGNDIITNIADISQSDIVSKDSGRLMHNKFIIFDKKIVYTGSMNISRSGMSDFDGNDLAIINSEEVAKLYTNEFEQMINKKFHNEKYKNSENNKFFIDKSILEVYFSPKYKSSLRIIELINSAKKYIYIPSFLITHKDISNALVSAVLRGVDVKIILDANSANTRNSKHSYLRENGIKLKFENYAGKLHSKTMIIDDKYTIMGSMNFSNSGENKNDENMIVITNSEVAENYKQYFLYLWELIPDKYLKMIPKAEGKYSIGSCSDGIDNDFNGKTDKDDPSCLY